MDADLRNMPHLFRQNERNAEIDVAEVEQKLVWLCHLDFVSLSIDICETHSAPQCYMRHIGSKAPFPTHIHNKNDIFHAVHVSRKPPLRAVGGL